MKTTYYALLSLCLGLLFTVSINAQNQPFKLKTTSATAASGATVCLDVEVYGGHDVLSMQYSMHYDPSVLTYQSIENYNLSGLSISSFGIPGENSPIPEGTINFSWLENNNELQPTIDGQILYQVCFNVIGTAGTYSEVAFGNMPTPFEVISTGDASLAINAVNGQVVVDGASAMSIVGCDITTIDCLDTNLGAVDITVEGGSAPYQFVWSDGTTTEDLSTNLADSYTVTITDADGTSISALFNLNYTNVSLILDATVSNAICQNSDGAISISPINDFSIVFNWSNGESTETITDLSAGDYLVTITDTETGCQQVETFTVEAENISFEATFICDTEDGPQLTIAIWDIGLAPYTVSLDNGESVTVDESNPVASFPATDGETYIITVTGVNGCTSTRSQHIACENSETMVIGLEYSCTGSDEAQLMAVVWSGGLAPYQLSVDGQTASTTVELNEVATFSVEPGATYKVTAIDANGDEVDVFGFVDCEALSHTGLVVSAPHLAVEPASSICIPIVVDSFIDITSMQFGMSWDTDVLSFDELGNFSSALSLNDSSFGSHDAFEDGILRFSWFDSNVEGVTVADGSTIFEVCFSVIGDPGSSSIFNVGDASLLITEAINFDGDHVPLSTVNGSISINGGNTTTAEVTLVASDEVAYPDGGVCIDVSVEDFTDILSMQYSMQWDATVMTFTGLQFPETTLNALNVSNFGNGSVNNGVLTVSWFEPNAIEGVSLADGTILFQVCFDAIGRDGDSSTFQFTNSPTPIEINNDRDETLTFVGQDGLVTIDLDGFVVPGDTDRDSEANHYDLLNIGLGFGQTGSTRPNASLEFTPQASEDWGISTPMSGVDYKHADTDGNGIIDEADIEAISMNWGETIHFFGNEPTSNIDESNEARELMSPFFVLPDTISAGEEASFPIILGTQGFPATGVYGIAFSLVYDAQVIVTESVYADFTESWLGQLGDDMISVQKDFSNSGQIDIAISRTDGLSMNGVGQVGRINVIIEEVIFRSDEEYELKFEIKNVRAINPTEESIIFNPTPSVSIINTEISGTNNPELEQLVTISPNPVQDYFNIQVRDINIEQVDIYNINGQLMQSDKSTDKVMTNHLSSGTYLVKIITEAGVLAKRIIIQK